MQPKNKNNWKEIVSLKHSAEKIWDTDKHRDSIEWGKLLHLALSKINKATDLEKVLEDLLIKGVCDRNQKKELYSQISLILRNNKVAKYFTPNWIVRNESQILVNTGETYIPDRLVFDGNQVVVIDYKTGEIEPNHQIQVDKYANFLREMGYEVVSTELLYTKSMLEA